MVFQKYLTAFLLVVVLGLASAVGSDDPGYTLVSFENDTFQDYAFHEFLGSIGKEETSLLGYYRCNGLREHEIFRALPVENGKADSLRIQNSLEDEPIVYREGRYFNLDGSPVERLTGEYVLGVASALREIEALPSGRILLRLIERSRFPVTIRWKKWVGFFASRRNSVLKGMASATAIFYTVTERISTDYRPVEEIGAGGDLSWKPGLQVKRVESDGIIRNRPAYVSLAHEMYHAYDTVRGLLDTRMVVGKNFEPSSLSEYRAMYFENQIRKESGFLYAAHYGNDGLDMPGILDKNGEPIMMPEPCLSVRK